MKSISVIIPTHNRRAPLERMLRTLEQQSFPLEKLEVVVVADGCADNTCEMLQSFTAAYKLVFIELPGNGPAKARNEGAAIATGEILLFLDDDIEPSNELLKQHVNAHKDDNSVVVGYLPLKVPSKPDFFLINIRSWWENKYHLMRHPGYRFSYEDLLSGNFSVSSHLFKKINGFDENLRCREDYELGIRLIRSGANFIFNQNAWGYHNDESNNVTRLLKRKRNEGKADIQLSRVYKDLMYWFPYYGSGTRVNRSRRLFFFLVYEAKWLGHLFTSTLTMLLPVMEKLRLRSWFSRSNLLLNRFAYFRGVAEEIPSLKAFQAYLQEAPLHYKVGEPEFDIDLQKGVDDAERELDKYQPASVNLYYGEKLISKLNIHPAAENLKGRHLRKLLSEPPIIDLLLKVIPFSVNTAGRKEAEKQRNLQEQVE